MRRNKIDYPLSFKVFAITLLVLVLGGMLILFSASSRVSFNIDGNATDPITRSDTGYINRPRS